VFHSAFETLELRSKDGLPITADYYAVDHPHNLILLCHRSHCNRGEYRETAPKLNKLGFSCLAIDQRSGMNVFGVINETSTLAKQRKLPTGYLEARPDIEAATEYGYELNGSKPLLILGSSYSASLTLMIATKSDKIKAVVAFSPGEHLKHTNVAEAIKTLAIPVFVTGAKKEIDEVSQVVRFIDPSFVTLFRPESDGFHGSKTLWKSVQGHDTYWQALSQFLSKHGDGLVHHTGEIPVKG
jgi:alpha-beta hydrolase superfamily lysophospholipase